MSVQTLTQRLTIFWKVHETLLKELHSGLNLRHFTQAFLDGLPAEVVIDENSLVNMEFNSYLVKWQEHVLSGMPLAFWQKRSWFHHISLSLKSGVLIPRPETELLVELALGFIKNNNESVVVDVGTGPGTIILALAHAQRSHSRARFFATDLDQEALLLATRNAYLWRLDHVQFSCGDRLNSLPSDLVGKVDLIVSNPPYIKINAHRHLVHEQVARFEPHLALFLDDAVYRDWFIDFFKSAYLQLAPNGRFLMEGHELELEALAVELTRAGFCEVELKKDDNQRVRFVLALKK